LQRALRAAPLALLLLAGCNGALLDGFARAMVMVALFYLALLALGALAELAVLGVALRGFRRGEAAKPALKVAVGLVLLGHALVAADAVSTALTQDGRAEPSLWILCLGLALPAAGAALTWAPRAIPRTGAWNARIGGAVLAAAAPVLLSCLILWPWTERAVPPNGRAIGVVETAGSTCALTDLGEVACWGDDSYGGLGVEPRPRSRARASLVPELGPASALVAGQMHACVLASRRALCWGSNEDGQLGPGVSGVVYHPTALPGLGEVVEIGAAEAATWAREAGGRLVGFGEGLSYDERAGVVELGAVPADTVETAVGQDWWCARRANAALICASPAGAALDLGIRVTDLAGAGDRACAIQQDGRVLCFAPRELIANRAWDEARREQMEEVRQQVADLRARAGLDPEPATPALAPVGADLPRLEGLVGATQIAAEEHHFCAMTRAGEVWCWGTGFRGALGDGSAEDHDDARRVELPGPAKGMSLSEDLSCAFLEDGRSFCWGGSPPGAPEEAYTLCHRTWLGPLSCVPRPVEVRWW